MAHTSCPNGHGMWNGDGKPIVFAVRNEFIKKLSMENPNIIFDHDIVLLLL